MSALAETLAERGAMLTALAKFIDHANPQDTWLLSELLHAWDNHAGHLEDDSEQFEAITLELVSLAGDRREKPQNREGWPKLSGALYHSPRGCLVQGVLKFALEQNDELVADLHNYLGTLLKADRKPSGSDSTDQKGGAS